MLKDLPYLGAGLRAEICAATRLQLDLLKYEIDRFLRATQSHHGKTFQTDSAIPLFNG